MMVGRRSGPHCLVQAVLACLFASGVLGCAAADPAEGSLSGPVRLAAFGPGEPSSAADVWWQSILNQCREAARDEDSERLASLLLAIDGRPAPAWADEALARFRSLLRANQLVEKGVLRVLFLLSRPDYATGDMIWLRLRLENRSQEELLLPAPGGEGVVRAEMHLEDRSLDGQRWQHKEVLNLSLAKGVALGPGEVKDLGFEPITASLGRGVVLRTVTFQGRLLLGKIVAAREELPLSSLPVAPTLLRIFPKGYEPIRAEPLLTLRRALELGDAKHFPHILLSVYFLRTGGHRPEALVEAGELLVEKLRAAGEPGNPLERVLEASLKELSQQESPL